MAALYRGYAVQWTERAHDWKLGQVAQHYKLRCELKHQTVVWSIGEPWLGLVIRSTTSTSLIS